MKANELTLKEPILDVNSFCKCFPEIYPTNENIKKQKANGYKSESEIVSLKEHFSNPKNRFLKSDYLINDKNTDNNKDGNRSCNLDTGIETEPETPINFLRLKSKKAFRRLNFDGLFEGCTSHNSSLITNFSVKINNTNKTKDLFGRKSINAFRLTFNYRYSDSFSSLAFSRFSSHDNSCQFGSKKIIKPVTINYYSEQQQTALQQFKKKRFVHLEEVLIDFNEQLDQLNFSHDKNRIFPNSRLYELNGKTHWTWKSFFCCQNSEKPGNQNWKRELSLLSFYSNLSVKSAQEPGRILLFLRLFSLSVQIFFLSIKFGTKNNDNKWQEVMNSFKKSGKFAVWVNFNDTLGFDKPDFKIDLEKFNAFFLISVINFVRRNFESIFDLNMYLFQRKFNFLQLLLEFIEVFVPQFHFQVLNRKFLKENSVLKSFDFYFELSFIEFLKSLISQNLPMTVLEFMKTKITFVLKNLKNFKTEPAKINKQDLIEWIIDQN